MKHWHEEVSLALKLLKRYEQNKKHKLIYIHIIGDKVWVTYVFQLRGCCFSR